MLPGLFQQSNDSDAEQARVFIIPKFTLVSNGDSYLSRVLGKQRAIYIGRQ